MRVVICVLVFLVMVPFGFAHPDGNRFPVIRGPYLGQEPPGLKADRFAPSVFYNNKIPGGYVELHSTLIFSTDGSEIYFQKHRWSEKAKKFTSTNLVMRSKNGVWKAPVPTDLFKRGTNVMPVFSPGGNRIFFAMQKQDVSDEVRRDRDIWMAERRCGDWANPLPLGSAVNTDMIEGCPSVAGNGNLYFYRRYEQEKGSGEILLSRLVDGRYQPAVRLDDSVNTGEYEALPVIAPDESFLIFYRMGKSIKKGQYISFKKEDGSWTPAKEMGDSINCGGLAFSLSLSPDGKYLFYLLRENATVQCDGPRREPGIYWIDARIIGRLRP